MTAEAFKIATPGVGVYILITSVFFLSICNMFSSSNYVNKCLGFLIGVVRKNYYNYFYVIFIVLSSIIFLSKVVDIIEVLSALMAIPTMTTALILSPKVRSAARDYFRKMRHG